MKKESKKNTNLSLQKAGFFSSRLFVFVFAIAGITNIINLIWALAHIKKTEIPVPIRYTSLTNFDQLGKWYQLYFPLAISIAIFAINTFLAMTIYKKSRLISIFLLFISFIIAVFALAMTFGFTSINYGTG